jgi:hypothetical protein
MVGRARSRRLRGDAPLTAYRCAYRCHSQQQGSNVNLVLMPAQRQTTAPCLPVVDDFNGLVPLGFEVTRPDEGARSRYDDLPRTSAARPLAKAL